MKKLLVAVSIFTALTFLALLMGEIAQSQPPRDVVVHGVKDFVIDNGNAAVNARNQGSSKAEMTITYVDVDGKKVEIEVTVTNPCTYVRVGSTYYKKCYN